MKTLNKLHQDKNGFKGWTHLYEDGPLIQNESNNEMYIVNIAITSYEDQLQFYIYVTNDTYDVLFEHYTTELTLDRLNYYLQSIDQYYQVTITTDEYLELLHTENI